MFFETSAKTAQNVEESFLSTASLILDNIDKGEYDLTNEVKLFSINLQSIGIKPGNALPIYAASGADKKRKAAESSKQLSNQQRHQNN